MFSLSEFLSDIFLLTSTIPELAGPISTAEYALNAGNAFNTLQNWYNSTTGLYNNAGWWNSANCLTVVGDLAVVAPLVQATALGVLENSLIQAPQFNSHVAKIIQPDFSILTTVARDVEPAAAPPGDAFLNGFYDDEGWWALAWVQAYDATGNTDYLQAAADIFEDMKAGSTTPCGGIWWDKANTYVNAIANELFLSVASHLANRRDDKQYYLDTALGQWTWFQETGMINADNTINDGLNDACENNGAAVWSYNQGVILGALVELNIAAPDDSYLGTAANVAKAAIGALSDDGGILHDPCEPGCGPDASQFKGVFLRGLQKLQLAAPDDAFLTFIRANADSIWDTDRTDANELGVVWSGPFVGPADPVSQSSAMDALVAAASV